MNEKNLVKTVQPTAWARERTRNSDPSISPAVDIFETEDGLTVMADMPGLDEKSLDVSVEQGVLTIAGDGPGGGEDRSVGEFVIPGYRRQFLLSDSYDAEKAQASIRYGVLTLWIPKAEAARPRKVAVSVH